MFLPQSGEQAEDHLDSGDHDKVKDPDAHADGQGAQQHGAGVFHHGLPVRPDDLLQFAFHFAEPLTAASFLLDFFCHNVYTPFLIIRDRLLSLGMERVLLAEGAVLVEFQLVRSVLLVLHGVVVSLLALVASQSDLHAHLTAPPYYWGSLSGGPGESRLPPCSLAGRPPWLKSEKSA